MSVIEREEMDIGETVMTALGSDVRRSILRQLSEQARSVNEIAVQYPISRPAISKHLKLLCEAGLIAREASGVRNIYRLNQVGFRAGREWLDAFWPDALGRFRLVAENTYQAKDDE